MDWDDLMTIPGFREKVLRVQCRDRRRDRLVRIRHRFLPFLHDWRGPYGDDAKCAICDRRVPMTAVDNWRGRIGMSACSGSNYGRHSSR